jgi:hypothetical protein
MNKYIMYFNNNEIGRFRSLVELSFFIEGAYFHQHQAKMGENVAREAYTTSCIWIGEEYYMWVEI